MIPKAYIWISIYDKPENNFDNLLSTSIHCIVETTVVERCIKVIDSDMIGEYIANCFAWHPGISTVYVRIHGQDISTGNSVYSKWL